jgi:hypothetical protein
VSACLLVAGKPLLLASAVFTLGWTHSVEKTAWVEHWRIRPDALVLEHARVKGSGAGMEPGENARLENGWWVWPVNRAQEGVRLAASGATSGGWRLCAAGRCRALGARPGRAVDISLCP